LVVLVVDVEEVVSVWLL